MSYPVIGIVPRSDRYHSFQPWKFDVDAIVEALLKSTSSISKYHLPFSQDRDEFLYTGLKTVNVSEDGNFSTSGQFSLGDWWNTILCTDFFFEHFSCFHRNTRQHSGPHCTSQSVVDSSSNKIFAPLAGYDWFLCWRYCSAAFCCLFDGNNKWQMANSLQDFEYFELYLLWIFSHNSYCHLRGQTSRAVTGIEIQTHTNFKTNSLPCCLLLASINWKWFYILIVFSGLCQERGICCDNNFLFPFGLLSRQNLSQTATASSPSTTTCCIWTSKWRRNSNEHWAIQKDCLHHCLGAVSIGVLLFPTIHLSDSVRDGI